MRVLITVATAIEENRIREALDKTRAAADMEIASCRTGPGLLFVAARLTEAVLRFQPDFALQLGIAGAYGAELKNGDLVAVAAEQIADLGAENHPDGYLDLYELGLMDESFPEIVNGKLINPLASGALENVFYWVEGLSVNVCTGTVKTAEERLRRYGSMIETMEGAAFHYVCLRHKIPFLQLRAISNAVGIRDKFSWDIDLAMSALRKWLAKDFISTITSLQNIQAL